jgi:hypothetical protein
MQIAGYLDETQHVLMRSYAVFVLLFLFFHNNLFCLTNGGQIEIHNFW